MKPMILTIVIGSFIGYHTQLGMSTSYPLTQESVESDSIDKLKNSEMKVREQGAGELIQSRQKLIQTLLTIASGKKDELDYRGTKELAIETLGELRAIEAVPFLVNHVDFRVPFKRKGFSSIGGYPSARALVKIGSPLYPEVWERLRRPASDLEISLFAYVIRQVDEEEGGALRIEVARKRAEDIATADGVMARRNLYRLLEHYKTKKTGF